MLGSGLQPVRTVLRALALRQLAEGHSIREVATNVGLTPKTGVADQPTLSASGTGAGFVRAATAGEGAVAGRAEAATHRGPGVRIHRRRAERAGRCVLRTEEAVKRKLVPRVGRETIRVLLESHDLKPWREKNVVRGRTGTEYIERMEEVLAVYEKPFSEQEPVVCVDEKPVVLHQEIRPPLAMRPGCAARRDGEYQRCGTANVFCGVEPKAGRHFPKVTATRSLPRVCRLLAGGRGSLPTGGHHPLGDGQSELAYTQGCGGTFWRESGGLAVGSVHRPLHPQAWQLVEPSRDRHQSVFAAMPGPTPYRRSSFSAEGNSGLEPSHEPTSSSDPVEVYS